MMDEPFSPPPATESGRDQLPAYVSNGLVGLRVMDIPLLPGVVLVSGYTGLHPSVQVEAAAQAPYPIAGDLRIDGVWLRNAAHLATFREQRYDFSSGELHTTFTFRTASAMATVEVLTFCSRKQPTLVLQELTLTLDESCDLSVQAVVDISKVHGRMARRAADPPDGAVEGSMAWESLGEETTCGIAYVTTFDGPGAEREVIDQGLQSPLITEYRLRATPGRRYRLRQIASLVPSRLHADPDRQATRLVARAGDEGFDAIREENRAEWREQWKGRILIDADDGRWQRLADAAYFYLHTSVHPSAPAGTSIYGLAQWRDYHYYYGHVMWDVELFCIPPLLLGQPDAARGLLTYRTQTLDAARRNAGLNGRRGLQYPWEAGPLHGEETAPGTGRSAWHEDHVSLDVAWAFCQYAHVTGDRRFLRDEAVPVVYGVADWITSRVSRDRDPSRFSFRKTMGIAERSAPADNDAYTVMLAQRVLREAVAFADTLGHDVPPAWREVLAGLHLPRDERRNLILTHDDFDEREDKGSTPGPLAGLFPIWHQLAATDGQATLEYYLGLADDYVGSPMLSPLLGVWAAWAGQRERSLELYEQGYAELIGDRFLQTLEQSPTRYPEKPRSGPFFANMGGFLMGLLFGLPGIRVGAGEPASWPTRRVVLPDGWRSIRTERAWIRMEPHRIEARHGDERARIEPAAQPEETGSAAA